MKYGSPGPDGKGRVRHGRIWTGQVWQSGQGFARCGLVGPGSRGTDVMGRVGCGAAGSLQWNGEMGYETERGRSGRNLQRFGEAWSHPVWQSRNGPDIFGGAG
jgi:hypothetical protein